MENQNWHLELVWEDQDVEKIKKHIYYPLYYNSYEDALRIIFLRILRNWEEKELCGEKFSYGYNDEEGNIIPFLGKRGSGKTTAMIEFCEILKKLDMRDEYYWWIEHVVLEKELQEKLKAKKFCFRVLKRIDVSSLENKEDLFELIMSEIFRLYMEAYKDYSGGAFQDRAWNQKILQKFNNILKGYYAIRDSREDEFGDSYITKLNYMTSSFELREQIEELIREIFEKVMKQKDDFFIVIVVDDLDLNIRHGYDMLEQLHKYFSNQYTLITLSADYDQLNQISKCHYIKAFSVESSHVIENMVKDKCAELAKDYIAKILPVNNRTFLPDITKSVRMINVRSWDGNLVTIKDYILWKTVQKIQIIYDISGLKKHFIEPKTVRELTKYNYFLDTLLEISYDDWDKSTLSEQEKMDYMERYDQNHERYMNDIINRLVNHLLLDEQRGNFSRLMNVNLERRAKEVCAFLQEEIRCQQRQEMTRTEGTMSGALSDVSGKDIPTSDIVSYIKEDYSYGDLLEGIYRYGRISDKHKGFIKCILASFTAEMVRERISMQKNLSEVSRIESRKRLKGFLGDYVGNNWLNDMLPQIKKESWIFPHAISAKSWILGESIGSEIFSISDSLLKKIRERPTRLKSFMKELKEDLLRDKFFASIEWLGLFINIQKKEGVETNFPFLFSVERLKESVAEMYYDNEQPIWLGFKNISVVVGIWEFFAKTLDLETYVHEQHRNLSEELGNMICGEIRILDSDKQKWIKEEIFDWAEENSIFNDYLNNMKDTMAFPFYNFDLAYNVMKRARQTLLGENPQVIKEEEIMEYIKKAYEAVEKQLKNEEERYYQACGIKLSFSETFSKFPLVQMIKDGSYETRINLNSIMLMRNILIGKTTGEGAGEYVEG